MTEIVYYAIVKEEELGNGQRLFLEIEGQPIVLFNIASNYFAISDTCTHDDGPLGEGDLDGYEIICPRHGARFDLRDGRATRLPAVEATQTYPVRVVEGMIEVGVAG